MIQATLVLMLCLATDDRKPDPPQPQAATTTPPDAQFRALRDDYQAKFDAFVKLNNEAKTPEEKAQVLVHPGRRAGDFSGGFLDLARKYPGTSAAEDALLWVGTHVFFTLDCQEAQRRLVKDHIRSAKLGPCLGFQGHYSDPFEGTEAFLRAVMTQSPHHDIQGLATYWLARHLGIKAQWTRSVKLPSYKRLVGDQDYFREPYGADWVDRLQRLDSEALDREAESLYERVAKFYADVPHNDKRRKPGPLGEVAAAYLRETGVLGIGKPAPDVEGTDLDGRPFHLADVRGKVVVLDFGSHFYCGVCRQIYPQMRTLTKRLEGRDFALISINAEPEKVVDDLKDAWKTEGNTWRCLFDGNWEGPIQKAWNIQRFPTIYVLDAKGVIRHKNLVGKDLEEAVDKLLAESARAQ